VPELVVEAWITRTELALADLQLVSDVYKVWPVIEASNVMYERVVATSPFFDGGITVMRKKAQSNMQVKIDAIGTTAAIMQGHQQVLVNAFTQNTFEFHIRLESNTTYAWEGECADHAIEWEQVRIHNLRQTMTFDFPSYPVPILGPA